MSPIIVQAFGFAGLACFFISYQIRSNRGLYLCQLAASILFGVQFLLLGAYSGCVNMFIAILRNIMLSKIDQWKWVAWQGWIGILTAIYLLIMLVTWQGPLSILPFLAMTSSTIGYWTNNAQKIRLSILACAGPSWLIYNAAVGSIGGFVNEVVTIGSILISIFRYGWRTMGEEDSGFGN